MNEMNTKVCSKCKTNLKFTEFNMDCTKPDRLQTQCRSCKRKIQKADYRKKADLYLDRQRKTRREFPEKKIARDKVRRAILKGDLNRPLSCSKCGNSEMRIEAHHHKGYAIEHALDVVFLCTSCHRIEDGHVSK